MVVLLEKKIHNFDKNLHSNEGPKQIKYAKNLAVILEVRDDIYKYNKYNNFYTFNRLYNDSDLFSDEEIIIIYNKLYESIFERKDSYILSDKSRNIDNIMYLNSCLQKICRQVIKFKKGNQNWKLVCLDIKEYHDRPIIIKTYENMRGTKQDTSIIDLSELYY